MTVDIKLYDFARKEMKLSEEKAKEFVQTIDEMGKANINDQVSTKYFVKEEITAAKDTLREEIRRVELSLTKAIFWSGLIQFMAIIGSVIAIVNFLIHK